MTRARDAPRPASPLRDSYEYSSSSRYKDVESPPLERMEKEWLSPGSRDRKESEGENVGQRYRTLTSPPSSDHVLPSYYADPEYHNDPVPARTAAQYSLSPCSDKEEHPPAFLGLLPPLPPLDWGRVVWEGKCLCIIGLDLKRLILSNTGPLGCFSKIKCVASHLGEAVVGLLPLPVPEIAPEETYLCQRDLGLPTPGTQDVDERFLVKAAGAAAWRWLVITSLNYCFAGRGKTALRCRAVKGPPSEAQAEALRLWTRTLPTS